MSDQPNPMRAVYDAINDVRRAFGAPGDYGYDTPEGAALFRLYSAQVSGLTQASRDVLAERQRQISAEGWTPEHDDKHDEGELAKAAACYAWAAFLNDAVRGLFSAGKPPPIWPEEWDVNWWKPTSRRRDLVKAGALILAEIERLDRLAVRAQTEGEADG